MSLDAQVPRSRRALLGAALGGVSAFIATSLGRPGAILANDPNDVVLGAINSSATTTTLQNTTTLHVPLKGTSVLGDGLYGHSAAGDKSGVYGANEVYEGFGVVGRNEDTSCWGALGSRYGGVHGEGTGPYDGVDGRATFGDGVRGESQSGNGGHFYSSSGDAIYVHGKARFHRSGRATVSAGKRTATVAVPGGLAGAPMCFATLASYRSGTYVIAARPNYPDPGKLRIYLNRAASSNASVSWFVLG